MTEVRVHREVERKLRVPAVFDLPDLVASGVAAHAEVGAPFTMTAIYHDTDDLALFRWGVTLRRREGGHDEGWHMKLPVAGADGSARDELRVPLSAIGAVPPALVEIVSPLLRQRPVLAQVELSTERTPIVLTDAAGKELVEVVDDTVTVHHGGRLAARFREVEVEALHPDDPASLATVDAVVAELIARGAEPTTVSKAASALGSRTQAPPDVPAWPAPQPSDLAVDAIRAVLAQHVRHLLMADVAVRRDLPDSVHQMRVAARRLRSALATFGPLLREDDALWLREELAWLASELGAIRDTEVMKERLDEHAALLAQDTDTARVRAVIDPVLTARLDSARSSALAALRSDRHAMLIDDLVSAAIDPPVTDAAFAPCSRVLLPHVARTWRRLRRCVSELTLTSPSTDWHRARIIAKRARYAADAVAGIFGDTMVDYAQTLAEVTDILGDHQDAHVAQGILRELATHPDIDGATGMALGLLYEVEGDEELLDRVRFRELWPHVRRAARRAGVA